MKWTILNEKVTLATRRLEAYEECMEDGQRPFGIMALVDMEAVDSVAVMPVVKVVTAVAIVKVMVNKVTEAKVAGVKEAADTVLKEDGAVTMPADIVVTVAELVDQCVPVAMLKEAVDRTEVFQKADIRAEAVATATILAGSTLVVRRIHSC